MEQDIGMASIIIPKSYIVRRDIDKKYLTEITHNIKENGLKVSIVVRKKGIKHHLVDSLYRYMAYQNTIRAKVI